ncbi:MAG TPA: SET domain-containing protein-lysine N-methyltransferase [Verrucomicrobiales bacterium]|nr:SET domain-containing protein-lysine N-methyltransferase [Verrucomicrobiales bacterium]
MEEVIVGRVVFRGSRIHGMGGFARTTIRKGTRIIEYVGEQLDKAEAQRRCEAGNVYVFEINDTFDIDGSVDWNPARWINHSCDPNAETDVVDDRVWIIATRTIRPGEEIVYNYNFDLDEYEDYPCNCGAQQCIGFMVAEKHWAEVKRRHGDKRNGKLLTPAAAR